MSDSVFYQSNDVLVFQNMIYSNPEAAINAMVGNIELAQSTSSGLVYNGAFNSDLLNYDEKYQNEQAHSQVFKAHLQNVLNIIKHNFSKAHLGIEIGCGKGYFLNMARQSELPVIGYDPAYEGNNPNIRKEYYNPKKVKNTPDFFILRHVLEHISNPWSFLETLASRAKNGCKIYIEVPCFDWIVDNNAFYDIFYEHCNYFTLNVLCDAFDNVIESGHIFGDQYIYIIADLSSFFIPKNYTGKIYSNVDFNTKINTLSTELQGHKTNYIWGAGAKGVTLSNFLLQEDVRIEALVDINPAKQGGFIGHSALPVVSPQVAMQKMKDANVIVMNPNYLNEIKELISGSNVEIVTVA